MTRQVDTRMLASRTVEALWKRLAPGYDPERPQTQPESRGSSGETRKRPAAARIRSLLVMKGSPVRVRASALPSNLQVPAVGGPGEGGISNSPARRHRRRRNQEGSRHRGVGEPSTGRLRFVGSASARESCSRGYLAPGISPWPCAGVQAAQCFAVAQRVPRAALA